MKNIIGIDIGGTKITGIVFDPSRSARAGAGGKKVVNELTIATPKNLFEFKRNLLKLVDFLSVKQKIYGIGVGMAGLVDSKSGLVSYSPNIKFVRDLNLAKFLKRAGIKSVRIDNDANCFARGELALGQGTEFKNFIAITLGTGIGGAIVIDGRLYRGQNNSGAELGHTVLGGEFFEVIFRRYRDKKDFKNVGVVVGRALASFINIFAPEAIIIGGGFGKNESRKYLPEAKRAMAGFIFNEKANTKILVSQLKNAGSIGAALLIK
jgi:glucokinase